MPHKHKAFLSSLLVAALALPAGAQTPADTTVKDTTAPAAKKSRFGGLMSKAKAVAGNKAVQGAVKGAATNVACNAVPGVAIAAAVSGGGPCQNTIMGGLVQKGVAGTAAAMAGGAASGVAAKAAGKMGGTTAAAAAGALGATTGGAGLKGAAAAAVGGKVHGLSQAAAAAAAAKMMKGAGGANAAAGMAGMAGMTGAAGAMPNAATIAAAQAAAARMMPNGGAIPNMGAAMGMATAGGKAVETVDFRTLKALLPESVKGMSRTDATGEKSGAMGITISSAEGSYASGDKTIGIKIADIGSLNGVAGMTSYAWAANEIDRESDSGYEKTTTFKGYKALEKYDRKNHSGEVSVLVGGRFIVEAQGDGVDMDAIKTALGSVDLKKLEGMKGKGTK